MEEHKNYNVYNLNFLGGMLIGFELYALRFSESTMFVTFHLNNIYMCHINFKTLILIKKRLILGFWIELNDINVSQKKKFKVTCFKIFGR